MIIHPSLAGCRCQLALARGHQHDEDVTEAEAASAASGVGDALAGTGGGLFPAGTHFKITRLQLADYLAKQSSWRPCGLENKYV